MQFNITALNSNVLPFRVVDVEIRIKNQKCLFCNSASRKQIELNKIRTIPQSTKNHLKIHKFDPKTEKTCRHSIVVH